MVTSGQRTIESSSKSSVLMSTSTPLAVRVRFSAFVVSQLKVTLSCASIWWVLAVKPSIPQVASIATVLHSRKPPNSTQTSYEPESVGTTTRELDAGVSNRNDRFESPPGKGAWFSAAGPP